MRFWYTPCLALALAAACAPAPLEGKGCPCVGSYVCCTPRNMCLRPDEVCTSPATWPVSTAPTTPVPMDGVTVYAFSQVDGNNDMIDVDDPQLAELRPDVIIRAWAQWDRYGLAPIDYQFPYITRMHEVPIPTFMGGATATVLFRDQLSNDALGAAEYDDFATRDANGDFVVHTNIENSPRRSTLANPKARDALVAIGQVQIDGIVDSNNVNTAVGVDGLHFEEINGGYQGASFDGNEGFDDYHLADFNAYLLGKYAATAVADLARRVGMSPGNTLRPDVPPWDLTNNFNYRRYLAEHGWQDDPFNAENPLAVDWGQTTINRPAPGASTFVDTAEPYVYWKDIVDKLRAYAKKTYGRDLLITGEGIWPFVDFQSVGLDLNNTDAPDHSVVHYVPVTAEGRLKGYASLKDAFLHLKQRSEMMAPGAPVVLFLDGRQDDYDAFPAGSTDRADFWRIYAAEAYANGLFFAFHLRSSVGKPPEPTATDFGLMPLFEGLAAFYRAHASYYHGASPSPVASATTSLLSAMVTVNDQLQPGATPADPPQLVRLVHVVNHEYAPGAGIIIYDNVGVTIDAPASDGTPLSITLASPDLPADVTDLPFSVENGQIVTTLPTLEAYDVLSIAYAPH